MKIRAFTATQCDQNVSIAEASRRRWVAFMQQTQDADARARAEKQIQDATAYRQLWLRRKRALAT